MRWLTLALLCALAAHAASTPVDPDGALQRLLSAAARAETQQAPAAGPNRFRGEFRLSGKFNGNDKKSLTVRAASTIAELYRALVIVDGRRESITNSTHWDQKSGIVTLPLPPNVTKGTDVQARLWYIAEFPSDMVGFTRRTGVCGQKKRLQLSSEFASEGGIKTTMKVGLQAHSTAHNNSKTSFLPGFGEPSAFPNDFLKASCSDLPLDRWTAIEEAVSAGSGGQEDPLPLLAKGKDKDKDKGNAVAALAGDDGGDAERADTSDPEGDRGGPADD